MSIKRSRDYSRRPTTEPRETSAAPKRTTARRYSFDRDVASQPAEATVAYGATYRHGEDDLIEHTVFGRGLVTRVDGNRIEVLFKEGVKKLVHDPSGPKPPRATPAGAEATLAAGGSEPSRT